MLPLGRSVGEQIFACDEGVMGFHNDRRTGGKMSANDRSEVICFISLIYFCIYLTSRQEIVSVIKLPYVSYILAAFRPVSQSCT